MSQPIRILLSLVFGLGLGIGAAHWGIADRVNLVAQPVGTAWLNGLQMTIVPLVVALLVLGIAATADAARAGRLAARAMVAFLVVLWGGAILTAIAMPALLALWPLDPAAARALAHALVGAQPVGAVPGFGQFLAAMVPDNPISAAANSAFLPLIIFTLAFAFAVTRLAPGPRRLMIDFFQAIADSMLIVINWVLWLAPLGVGALALVVGAKAGTAAFGALLHYVITVSVMGLIIWGFAYPIAVVGGRVPLGRFLRATAPSLAVAISTQSSIASLPAMLRGTEELGVPARTSGIVLPLAVAIFRSTGPAMNLAVAIYIALWFGVPLTPASLAAGVVVASLTTLGAVSLPGAISYISSIAPIAAAMGVPIAPLGLLVAIETFPDIIRTLGNVANDAALTVALSRHHPAEPSAEDALLGG